MILLILLYPEFNFENFEFILFLELHRVVVYWNHALLCLCQVVYIWTLKKGKYWSSLSKSQSPGDEIRFLFIGDMMQNILPPVGYPRLSTAQLPTPRVVVPRWLKGKGMDVGAMRIVSPPSLVQHPQRLNYFCCCKIGVSFCLLSFMTY